ncbi:MAG: GEVED domain-containing protein, partial [Planctomycetota bacterium]
DYQFGTTDSNRVRDQGQLIIASNFISNTSGFGIVASAGDRGQGIATNGNALQPDTVPRPGAARLLRNENQIGLIPGSVIRNNVVHDAAAGGILFAGGSRNDGEAPAPVPYGRIVNNTVVGNGTGSGITVANSASPTILNNVVSGFTTGIDVDGTSINVGTILNGNAYANNATDSTIAVSTSAIQIPDGTPVFKDADRDLYIPATGSDIIDSSFSEIADRGDFFATVKDPVGISPSPIIAPGFDAYGQPRVDDPTKTSPGGVGQNVFIDRGAIDRADVTRPVAILTSPQDAINQVVIGGDGDPDESFVRLAGGTVEFFEVQILDPSGTGPDLQTITADSVLLTEDGRRLVADVDFTFGYSDNSNTIRLTPLAGLWRPDAVYEITLNNLQRIAYNATSGDTFEDGDQLTLTDSMGGENVFEFESGFTVSVPKTTSLEIQETNAGFVDRDVLTITSPDGNSLTLEIDNSGATTSGNVPVNLADAGTIQEVREAFLAALNGPSPADPMMTVSEYLDLVPVLVGNEAIQLGTLEGHVITGNVAGLVVDGVAGGIVDGETFVYTTPDVVANFEFDFDGDVTPDVDNQFVISLTRSDTVEEIANKITLAIQGSNLGLATAQAIGGGSLLIGGEVDESLDLSNTNLSQTGSPGVTGALTVSVPEGTVGADLDTLTFDIDVDGSATTFLYTTDPNLTSANRVIVVDAADTADVIATKTADQITLAFPDDLSPSVNGRVISLGEQDAIPPANEDRSVTTVNAGASTLTVDGVSGGAIPIRFLPTDLFTPAGVSAALQAGIADSGLQVETFSPGGGTLLISAAESLTLARAATGAVEDVGVLTPAVSDLAGNAVRETRINNETRFTIIMPEVVFDLGDAPESYGTLLADNGPRHTIGGAGIPILGQFVDSEVDGQPFSDSDDAQTNLSAAGISPVFDVVFNPNELSITVTDEPVMGGETLALTIGTDVTTYELVDLASNPSAGNVPVIFAPGDSAETIADNLTAAIRSQVAATNGAVRLAFSPGSQTVFTITSIDDEDGVPTGIFTSGGIDYKVFTLPNPDIDPTNVTAEQVLGFLNPLDPAGSNVAVTVTGGGLLDAWIDYDQNGTFEPDEQIFTNTPVVDGLNVLSVRVPSNATPGDTWARFRISDGGNLTPNGVAVGGEVEDYEISVLPIALPTPVDDTYSLDEDNTLVVDGTNMLPTLLDNDQDVNSQLLATRFFVGDQPANGTVQVIDQFAGHFVYTPNPDFFGVDTFTYRLSSQQNDSADAIAAATFATVTLNVAPVNDPPFAEPKEVATIEGGSVTVTAETLLENSVGHSGGPTLDPPFDESNQVISVLSVGAGGVTISSANPTDTATTPEGGTISATFDVDGFLETVTYSISNDFNSDNLPIMDMSVFDTFEYTIQDDGANPEPNFGNPFGTPLTS